MASIASSQTDLASNQTDLATGLEAAQTAIEELTAQLANVDSEEDLAAITDALAEVQADVRELLEANA